VIGLHGGFWRNRYSLEHFGHVCAALTAAGYLTWNLEYRRIGNPGGGWPGTFHDVVAGSRYLFEHAAELNADPERVIAIGHSAGGHLAAWLASLANVPSASEIATGPLPLKGAVSLAGVMDLGRAFMLGLSGGAAGLLLDGAPDEQPERYRAASPQALAPPPTQVIAIHGERDEIVPPAFSERYAAEAVAVGGTAEVRIVPGADHFDVIDPASAAWPEVVTAVRALLS
jgi:acetyl esterase/lipase